ncbi:MAG: hypothetical protein ACKVOE_01570 [Rickettsiales bacterium]
MIGRSIGQKHGAWQWLVAVAFIAVAPTPAPAAVEEVRVLAVGTDDSRSVAEKKAMDYARKRAVYLAAKKMGVPDPGAAAAKLTDVQLSQIIRGAAVVQSKREGKTTIQEIMVMVTHEPMARMMGMPDIPPPEAIRHRGVLVLPVLVGHDRPFLWEKENTLRPLLTDKLLEVSHGAVMSASGDFDDLRLIDYGNALKVKPEELAPMFARYGVQEIVIAILTLGPVGTTDPSNVLLRRLTPASEHTETFDVAADSPEQNSDERLARANDAIASTLTQIATSTAALDQAKLDKATKIPVAFAYANPRELANMQEAIRKAKDVLQLKLPEISVKQVTGTIYLDGERSALKQLLIKQAIHVTEKGDGWEVSLR